MIIFKQEKNRKRIVGLDKKIFAREAFFIHNETTMDKKSTSQQTAAAAPKLSKEASIPVKKPQSISLKKEKQTLQPINLSREEIARCAYFISERRRELGWEGNEQTDWIDAEKQLLAKALEGLSK